MSGSTDTPPGGGFTTRQLHAGGEVAAAAPRALPIHLTAGFRFEDWDEAASHFQDGTGFGYTRTGNPTTDVVERRIANLESGSGAVLFASGQAATAAALLTVAGAGDHVVVAAHIYEGTRGLLQESLARLGIRCDVVDDVHDLAAWDAARRPETTAFLAESVANARNDVLDIAAVSALGRRHSIPLIVDNTLPTPYLLRPLEHGAAMVVHSASKALSGHGSVIGGVVVDDGRFDAAGAGGRYPHLTGAAPGAASFADRYGSRAREGYLREVVGARLGATISPFTAFLLAQGMETLSLRVRRQTDTALALARWLEERPEVVGVDYAGLPTHPDHALTARYLPDGVGSVFTITLAGGLPAAQRFVESVRVFTHMTHIGDVRSLVLHPASTSHASRSPADRERLGVHPGTVRLSVGIEDPADLIADLERALTA